MLLDDFIDRAKRWSKVQVVMPQCHIIIIFLFFRLSLLRLPSHIGWYYYVRVAKSAKVAATKRLSVGYNTRPELYEQQAKVNLCTSTTSINQSINQSIKECCKAPEV